MRDRVLRLGGYAVAAAVQAGAAFAAVPLLTRGLGPAEYGRWALFEPLALTAAQVGLLGANHGLLKLVGEDRWPMRAAWLSLSGPMLLPLAFVAVAAGLCCVGIGAAMAAPAVVVLVVLEGLTLLTLAGLRSTDRSGAFASALIAKALLWLALLAWARQDTGPAIATAQAALWWLVLPTAAGCALSVALALSGTSQASKSFKQPAVPKSPYRAAVRYGLPLMATGLASTLISVGDRYVLAGLTDVVTLGQYVVLVKVASAVGLLAMPLNMWFPAARFAHLRDADGGASFFRRAALGVAFTMSACAGALWLLAPQLVAWFSPGQAADTLAVACLLLGAVSTASVGLMNIGLLQAGRTHWPLVCTGLMGALQLLLLLVLVPLVGGRGAAAAWGVAGVGSLVLQTVLSQRFHRLPFAYGRMAGQVLAVGLLCWTLSQWVESLPLQIAIYGPAMLALGWGAAASERRRVLNASRELP